MRGIRSVVIVAALGLIPSAARAGSPHFIRSAFTESCTQSTLTVTGKEAGLGDEDQVNIVLSATAECINPGTHHPRAENKESLSGTFSVPVQNGKADIDGPYTLVLTNNISPSCSPPMTIVWTDIVVTDTTNGVVLTPPLPDCTP